MTQQTCATCKYWNKPQENEPNCSNEKVIAMLESDERVFFMPPPTFGCNLWQESTKTGEVK